MAAFINDKIHFSRFFKYRFTKICVFQHVNILLIAKISTIFSLVKKYQRNGSRQCFAHSVAPFNFVKDFRLEKRAGQ